MKRASPATAAPATANVGGRNNALHGYVEWLARRTAGRRAIWLYVSHLDPSDRRDKHIGMARKALEELAKHFDGRLFVLANGDMVAICKDMADKAVRDTVELLRRLFEGDALSSGQFCELFDMQSDYPQFAAALAPFCEGRVAAPPPRPRPAASFRPARAERWRRVYLGAGLLVVVVLAGWLVEAVLAQRSSPREWPFDSADAQKAHQIRNSLTGEYASPR